MERNFSISAGLDSHPKEGVMKRINWNADEVSRLKGMAGKFPAAHIATELGRGLAATVAKAHKLQVSLRMKPRQEQGRANIDPGPAGMDLK
jgi:hypothetical protein